MEKEYRHVFDTVQLSPERQQEIRSELSSRLNELKKEDTHMIKKTKHPRLLAVALLSVLAFSLVGFTYGNKIINLLGGGRWETGTNEQGESFVSMDAGFNVNPVEIRDGQVYFTLDGSNRNITKLCSEETYFQYDTTDEGGIRHVILVGGTPDNIGWAEFIVMEDGDISSNATYHAVGSAGEGEPAWLTAGRTALENEN